jgi:HD superfamily phosphohydrolase
MDAPEIQRLYNIKQLGFAHLVFPGAHHTRLEHSLGTYYMAFKAAQKLNLDEKEKETIACAALLHDIGHGPFSHTLESIIRESLNVDHIDLTEKLIFGKHLIFEPEEKEFIGPHGVYDILNKHDINLKDISNIIRGKNQKKQYLSQLLNSSIDVDQLDYLIRDAYYTGVAYGIIDTERFLQTLIINDNQLAIRRKGVGVVENILMARSLMYSSVYFHKTVRIAELMLSKAIEMIKDIDPLEFFKMTDAELINDLRKRDTYSREIATRLKYRKLFKQAFTISGANLNNKEILLIKKLNNVKYRREKEKELEEFFNIPAGHIIIDVPFKELHLTEPRIDLMDISIFNENKTNNLDCYTPVAKAIKSRIIPEWALMIVTDEKYRNIVAKKVKELLFY